MNLQVHNFLFQDSTISYPNKSLKPTYDWTESNLNLATLKVQWWWVADALTGVWLVAPHAAGLTLLVAGMAQWVRYVCDRWQEKLLVREKLLVAGHVNLNVSQYCLTSTNRYRWYCAEEAWKRSLRSNFKKGKTMLLSLKVCESLTELYCFGYSLVWWLCGVWH
jgi:hypothetical protein